MKSFVREERFVGRCRVGGRRGGGERHRRFVRAPGSTMENRAPRQESLSLRVRAKGSPSIHSVAKFPRRRYLIVYTNS